MNWDYIAGFLDGEGSIKIYGSPRITVGQNTREVLDAIQEFVSSTRTITLSRGCFYLQYCHRQDVEYILDNIKERVIVKYDDVQAALRWFENNPSKAKRWNGQMARVLKGV